MFDDATRHERAQSLAALFGEVKARHHKVELGGRELLADARAAGGALLKIKAACGHGEFLPAIDRHWPGKRRTAQRYMRIAENWSEVHAAGGIAEALAWLSRPAEEPQEPPQPGGPNASRVTHLPGAEVDEGQGEAEPTPAAGTFGQACPELDGLRGVLRKLVAVQQQLSFVYAEPGGRRVIEDVQRYFGPAMRLHATQGTYAWSTLGGVEIVVAQVCNEPLADLIRFVASAVSRLKTPGEV